MSLRPRRVSEVNKIRSNKNGMYFCSGFVEHLSCSIFVVVSIYVNISDLY